MPTLPEYEALLRDALDAMGAAQRAELLHTLELTDFQRADRIGELWASPKTRSIAEFAIDAEEDRMVRALLVGMMQERAHGSWRTSTVTITALFFDYDGSCGIQKSRRSSRGARRTSSMDKTSHSTTSSRDSGPSAASISSLKPNVSSVRRSTTRPSGADGWSGR